MNCVIGGQQKNINKGLFVSMKWAQFALKLIRKGKVTKVEIFKVDTSIVGNFFQANEGLVTETYEAQNKMTQM